MHMQPRIFEGPHQSAALVVKGLEQFYSQAFHLQKAKPKFLDLWQRPQGILECMRVSKAYQEYATGEGTR